MDRWLGRSNCMRVSIHQWATCTNAQLLVFCLNRTSIRRIVHFRSITSFSLFWLHVCLFLPLPVRLSFHPFGFPSNCIRAFWFKLKRKECTLNICLTSLTRAKCGVRSTLCWKIPNISGSIELFCIVILHYGLKLHKLSNHTFVILQKWLEIH